MDIRKCIRCGEEKKITAFKTDKRFPDRMKTCRYCYSHNQLKEVKRTPEQIESQRQKVLGRKYSLEHRLAISKGQRKCVEEGRHPFAIKEKELPEKGRFRIEYKIWKENLLQKCENKCERCGENNRLHAHYKKSYYDFPELRYDLNNGEILCIKCHAKEHVKDKIGKGSWGKNLFVKGQKAPIYAFKKGNIPWNKKTITD